MFFLGDGPEFRSGVFKFKEGATILDKIFVYFSLFGIISLHDI